MPAGQGFVGKSGVSAPLVITVCRQVYLIPTFFCAWAFVFVVGLPTVIRNPLKSWASHHSNIDTWSTHWLERCNMLVAIWNKILLGIVDSLHSSLAHVSTHPTKPLSHSLKCPLFNALLTKKTGKLTIPPWVPAVRSALGYNGTRLYVPFRALKYRRAVQ